MECVGQTYLHQHLNRRYHLENLCIDWKIILKWILNKKGSSTLVRLFTSVSRLASDLVKKIGVYKRRGIF